MKRVHLKQIEQFEMVQLDTGKKWTDQFADVLVQYGAGQEI